MTLTFTYVRRRSYSPIVAKMLRGVLDSRAGGLRQRVSTYQLQPLGRVVTMDLLHIELAHEVDRFPCDHLAGHHDREARRIRDDEVRGDQIRTLFQSTVDFRIGKPDMIAMLGIVGCVEPRADIAFVGAPACVRPERFMEMREVRQVRHVGHQALYPCVEGLPNV